MILFLVKDRFKKQTNKAVSSRQQCYFICCSPNVSILTLLVNLFEASSSPFPKGLPARQVYSPELLTLASSSFTTAGFAQ